MLVIDTNVWISFSFFKSGILANRLEAVLDENDYALSNECFCELADVLMRARFNRFATVKDRELILKDIANGAEWYTPTETITDCRDPKDNMFLELAVTCRATAILTGDEDLLMLHPFRSIAIMTVEAFAGS